MYVDKSTLIGLVAKKLLCLNRVLTKKVLNFKKGLRAVLTAGRRYTALRT